MKNYFSIFLVFLILFITGCTFFKKRVPSKAITNPVEGKIIYFTKRDSIPKDVIYRPYFLNNNQIQSKSIDPSLIEPILNTLPKISDSFLSIKENILISDIELYINGIDLDSEDIKNMLDALKSNIDSSK